MPQPERPSLRDALTQARQRLETANIEDASLEAEILLRHALAAQPKALESPSGTPFLEVTRPVLYIHLDDPLPEAAAALLDAYLARRIAREPSAYITGHREFYSLDLAVTPATLIPRPDTETLVEVAIQLASRIAANPSTGSLAPVSITTPEQISPSEPALSRVEGPAGRGPGGGVIADIGTGSGAIAIALATALPQALVHATDSSAEALAVAETNARRHNVLERIAFHHGDLLSPLTQPIDLIFANLPYVTTADYLALEPEVRDHEPRGALDGGADGLDVIRRLLLEAPRHLSPHGAIALEFGIGQAAPIEALARRAFPSASIRVHADLASRPRVISIALPWDEH